MGFFDNLAETAFKKTDDGSEIYFPNGVIGKGRIVRDSTRRQKLFNYHKRIIKYGLPLMILYGLVVGASGGVTKGHLIFIGVVIGLLFARQRYLIAGLPVYSERLTVTEATTRGAKAFHPLLLFLFGGCSLILIAGGAALPILLRVPFDQIAFPMIGTISFGALGLSLSVYLYKARKSNNSIQPTQKPRG
jgi:hypothetical protein